MRLAGAFPLTILAVLLGSPVSGQISNMAAGYDFAAVVLPDTGAGTACADATNPNAFYLSAGFFNARRVYRVVFAGPTTFTATLVADGANSTSGAATGDNVLDNGFGDIWIHSLPDGRLIVCDNDEGGAAPGGPLGERVFMLTDLNADGDFRDIVGSTPEVATFVATPILSGSGGNFSSAGATSSTSGDVLVVTADGPGAGEVIRVSPDGSIQSLYFGPLDYGSGIDQDSAGFHYAGETLGSFTEGRVTRLRDENSDGDALDIGESLILTGPSTPAIYDLSLTSVMDGERLFAATNGLTGSGVDIVGPGGSLTRLCDLTDFATGMAFDSGGGTFLPNGGSGGQRLIVSNLSFSTLDGYFFVITPSAGSSVNDWVMYE